MPRKPADHDASLRPAILAAAARVLAVQGAARFSLRAVAEEVGISAPSIYHHYRSKDVMLTEVVRQGLRIFQERVGRTLDQTDLDPGERVRNCVSAHVRYEFEFSDIARSFDQLLGNDRSGHSSDTLRIDVSDASGLREAFDTWDSFARRLLEVIEEGRRLGLFRIDNVELATSAVVSLADGVLLWVKPGPLLTVNRIAEQYGQLALRLLGYDTAPLSR